VDRVTPSRAITTEVAGHTHRDKLRTCRRPLSALFAAATAYIAPLRPNAHRIIKGNSRRHISSSWPAGRSLITTSALASRNAAAHRAAFSRKKSSRVPATRYVCGIDSALRQAAGSPRRARLKKSRRSVPNVEAPVQGRVPHPPKLQTRPCARRGAICRNAIAQKPTSSTKNFSCAANPSGSNLGEYSWSRSVSSATRCTPTIKGGYTRCFKEPPPRRDHLTVTGEHDRLGQNRRDVYHDLPSIVVVECFSDKFAGDRVGFGRFWPSLGEFIHALIFRQGT
jgi:hypothetical protein